MKPSRWLEATGEWASSTGEHGRLSTIRWTHRESIDLTSRAYYRRLCLYYIQEAQRLRRERDEAEAIVLEISGGSDPAAWFSRFVEPPPMDDTFPARMAAAEEFIKEMGQ